MFVNSVNSVNQGYYVPVGIRSLNVGVVATALTAFVACQSVPDTEETTPRPNYEIVEVIDDFTDGNNYAEGFGGWAPFSGEAELSFDGGVMSAYLHGSWPGYNVTSKTGYELKEAGCLFNFDVVDTTGFDSFPGDTITIKVEGYLSSDEDGAPSTWANSTFSIGSFHRAEMSFLNNLGTYKKFQVMVNSDSAEGGTVEGTMITDNYNITCPK